MHFLATIMIAALGAPPAGVAPDRFALDNGLTVILRPADVPNVACAVLYDVGDANDPPGRSGLGHLVEHVYVTAAAGNRPAGDAFAWLNRYGGQANAQTGRDYTVVATVFGAGRLESELADAAARMGRLDLVQADLDREKPRLLKELDNMYDFLPHLTAQNLAAGAAAPLAEGHRKGGARDAVEALTLDDVQRHYERYYKPANATLVLVGGFDPQQARQLIEARLGPIEAGEPPPSPPPPAEPALGRIRGVETSKPRFGNFPDAVATVAYRAPRPGDDLYAAFVVLVGRLLESALPDFQRGGVVQPVSWAPLDLPELVFTSAVVGPGRSDAEAVAALRERVRKAVTIAGDEVDAEFVIRQYGLLLGLAPLPDAVMGMNPYVVAFSLGRRDQLGLDPQTLTAQIEALDADDLRRCAEAIFADERSAAVVVRAY